MSSNESTAMVRAGSAEMASPGDFGPEHMRIVREAFAPTASQAEFEVMWAGAKARRLDPVRKQIHFVKRRTKRDGAWVDQWTSIVAIDGFRAIAEGTGKYDGQDEPEYEYDDSDRLVLARVRVYRKDISRPFVGVARWNEYVQTNADGAPNATWAKMEHTMLAKCAEALGLRKAFPEPLAGLYTGEEMAQADNEKPIAPQWQRVDHPPPPTPPTKVLTQPRAPRRAEPLAQDDDLSRERARWHKDGGDENTERVLAASPDPADRALVFRWRISEAKDAAMLAAVQQDIARDPHDEMRADMLVVAENRRKELEG